MEIVTVGEIEENEIAYKNLKPPIGNKGKKKRPIYKDVICAFDIETTYIPDINQSVMYIWQMQIGNEYTVIGRTWDELRVLFEKMMYNLHVGEVYVIYVHNLSYEFQFLSGVFDFETDDVFAVDTRRILKCMLYNHFEFRCSYLLTNMSLDAFTYKMGVEHAKISGYDYSKKRYWFTLMSQEEIAYAVHDVIGLVEATSIKMILDGDDLYTIPLTSTGYVRREFKSSLRQCRWIKSLLPDYELYEMLREAFRGGNVHANRYFAGKILYDVKSADRSSSYPEVQCNHLYPIKPFRFVNDMKVDALVKMVKQRNKAVVCRLAFKNLSLIDETWGCPYLSKDKVRLCKDGIFDNGRILRAGYFETTVTDIDLMIILSEYKFSEVKIIKLAYSTYGMLPKEMTDLVKKYYVDKTALKGIEGKEYYYMKSKNLLNSIYGMTAQDPAIDSIYYIDGEYKKKSEDVSRETIFSESRPWLPYQWGVWCTAWARYELELGIENAHKQGYFIYADTDSVKYLGDVNWEYYNIKKIELSTKHGCYATDKKGITHYMGVYEDDGHYDKFITYGAKKYAYENEGHVHITIAGVPKHKGAEELQKAGGIEAIKNLPFIFNAGKLESVYNDDPEIKEIVIDGNKVSITKNVALRPTTYTLGITEEYAELLEDREIYEKAINILDIRNKTRV